MNLKKNILVTGTGGRSVGSGILHSLLYSDRNVAERWNVIATDADPFAWGLYKAQAGEVLPPALHPAYIEAVLKVVKKHSIDAIVPGTEIEGDVLLKNKDALKGVPLISNRKELYPLMMDKFATRDMLKEMGEHYIETLPLTQWKEIVDKYGFPIIVKPTRGTGGSKGLHIVADEKELEAVMPFINETTCPCVQPYIGNGEEEYTVGVLTDKEGQLIDSIVMKRKLIGLSLLESKKIAAQSFSISTGYSQGYIVKHAKIQEFCEALALKLNSVGPINIQLRIHNNEIYVFEIHPRFSGTTPIRADVGFNEVDILLRNHFYGEKFSRLDYQYDVAAIRAFQHVIIPIKEMNATFYGLQ